MMLQFLESVISNTITENRKLLSEDCSDLEWAKPSLSTDSRVNTIQSIPVISGINLDPNASALLSCLKGNCINLLHSGCVCEG